MDISNSLILFIAVTFLNVVVSTIKSILTIKGDKTIASLVSALSYGINTYAVFFTADDSLNLHIKALIVILSNLIGVYLVKFLEDIIRKDRLWVYEGTLLGTEDTCKTFKNLLEQSEIKCIYTTIKENKYYEIKIFASSKEDSKKVKLLLDLYNCKYYIIDAK